MDPTHAISPSRRTPASEAPAGSQDRALVMHRKIQEVTPGHGSTATPPRMASVAPRLGRTASGGSAHGRSGAQEDDSEG